MELWVLDRHGLLVVGAERVRSTGKGLTMSTNTGTLTHPPFSETHRAYNPSRAYATNGGWSCSFETRGGNPAEGGPLITTLRSSQGTGRTLQRHPYDGVVFTSFAMAFQFAYENDLLVELM